MKKICFAIVAMFCVSMMSSCIPTNCGCDKGECTCSDNCDCDCDCSLCNGASGLEDDGTGRTPSYDELIGKWQSNEYKGWEPRLEQDVVIARELTLNSDGSYTNRYRGRLTQEKDGSSLSNTEMGYWEEEEGIWSYNSASAEISYHPISDKRVNYETTNLETYTCTDYKEKCLIKTSGEYKGMWITLDTYLKRSGNAGDLRYALSKK